MKAETFDGMTIDSKQKRRNLMNLFKSAAIAAIAAFALSGTALHAGGVLRLDEVAVGELDPSKASDYADSILMFNVYDTLVIPRQGGPGHVPHLAESWEGSGKTFTFRLRDDVRFQSGNMLTAEDVVFTFDRMKHFGQGLSYLFTNVESASADGSSIVTFHLSEPYSPFIASLVRLPIIDKEQVMANLGEGEGEMGDWGQAFLSANGAGTGAYTVVSHNPQEETVMEKNADYFLGVPDAAPDTVRLRYGLEAATVRTLIERGEHDIASQWLPPEVIKALAESGAQILTEAGTGAFYVKMNTTKAPLDDIHCRQALSARVRLRCRDQTDFRDGRRLARLAEHWRDPGRNVRRESGRQRAEARHGCGARASQPMPVRSERNQSGDFLDRGGAARGALRSAHAGQFR